MQRQAGNWCRQEEDCIEEAVYRYQIQNSEGHAPTGLFFLSGDQGRDPSDEALSRLESSSYHVRPVSQSVNDHTVIKDRETGEPGVILSMGKISRPDKGDAAVDLSAYSGWGDVKGYVYLLKRGLNGWEVIERKFALES